MAEILIPISEPGERRRAGGRPPGLALWALGFRPFYLLAATWAALAVPLWVLLISGTVLPWRLTPVLPGAAWHAHEMVFGFALAVIVGFLYTAGRNWSGQPTPTGRPLMALAGLWLAGRLILWTPWPLAAALVNCAFPLAAALGLWKALRAGDNRRNDFFVLVLLGLTAAQAVFHAALQGSLHDGLHGGQDPALSGAMGRVALDLVAFVAAVMGGRVIPMFSNNGVPGLDARREPWLEPIALGSLLALLALDGGLALFPDILGQHPLLQTLEVALLALTAGAHGLRLALWQPWRTGRVPLVWVLHLAYAWLPVHLALRAWSLLTLGPGATGGPAVHALTVGLIGSLTLGMMTRTARGHTGRPLRAGRAEVAAYGLMAAAALLRVGLPLAWPAATLAAIHASATLWSLAWLIYLWVYTPWLLRSRVDGMPG